MRGGAEKPLTAVQIANFTRDGFVIVRDFFPIETVDRWRRQVWAATDASAGDWPEGDFAGRYAGSPTGGGPRNTAIMTPGTRKRLVYPFPGEDTAADPYPIQPAVCDEPTARAALDQLLGEGTYGAGIGAPGDAGYGAENDVVVCNFPGQHTGLGKPHVEGMRPSSKGGCVCRWFLGMTTYLDDVAPGGGGTYVWPKSHNAVHSYYRRYPQDIRSGGAIDDKAEAPFVHGDVPTCGGGGGMTAEYMASVCPGGYDGGEPVEAVMQKGDVMIWHHWCVHASSENRSDRVRQAIITRFHTTRWGEEQQRDAGGVATNGALWKYWEDDVRQVAAAAVAAAAAAAAAAKL